MTICISALTGQVDPEQILFETILSLFFILINPVLRHIFSNERGHYTCKDRIPAELRCRGRILKYISSSIILYNPASSPEIVFHWSYRRLSISIKKRGTFSFICGKILDEKREGERTGLTGASGFNQFR